MRTSVLQKLLDKQKQTKFGDLVSGERWSELLPAIQSGQTKLEDVMVIVQQSSKILPFASYMLSIEPNQQNLNLVFRLLPMIPTENLQCLLPMFRNLVTTYGQYQVPIVDLVVRSFLLFDSTIFSDIIIDYLSLSSSFVPIVSSAISKFFPQTSFQVEQQIRYLSATFRICRASSDIAVAVLARVIQHLVALDCELIVGPSSDGNNIIDEDVASSFSQQLKIVLDFLVGLPQSLFALLLQLFDLYLLDLPKAAAVQFLFFYAASFNHDHSETFVGFLIHKIIDGSASPRTRANAALYLSSFVARAKYIDDVFAMTIIDYVANYASCYVEHIKNDAPELFTKDLTAHWVFYYAVQCIAYVCCWRWKSWKKSGVDRAEKWKLNELFNRQMNAANCIDRNTAEMFASLGLLNIDLEKAVVEKIDVWFPFDPCPLDEISDYVAPIYTTWSNGGEVTDAESYLNQELNEICESRGISIEALLESMHFD